MKAYWSQKEVGDPAIIIGAYDLYNIILKAFDDERGLSGFDKHRNLLLVNKIIMEAEAFKLRVPFEGRDEELKEAFLRSDRVSA